MRYFGLFSLSLLALSACTSNDASYSKDAGAICGNPDAPQPTKSFEKPTDVPLEVDLGGDSVVVYYAVDTREKFMQAAVDEDIRSLRAACELTADPEKRAKVNWLAFLNSHFADGTPTFLMCEAGVFSENEYPAATLTQIKNYLNDPQNPASYANLPAELAAIKVDGYTKYPFAHFKVLGRVMSLARKLFDPATHVFHLHIKSHGSAMLALTGLTDEQTAAKEDCQNKILTAQNITLPQVEYGQAGVKHNEDGSVLSLGEGEGVTLGADGQVILGDNGQVILGDNGQVILGDGGQIILGNDGQIILGDEMGLGAASHFGSSLQEVTSEISNFAASTPNLKMGYVILEGCYSGGSVNFLGTFMPIMQGFIEKKVARIYAASGSLWYRNFEWSRYLTGSMAEGVTTPSAKLVEILDDRSANVVNWQKAP